MSRKKIVGGNWKCNLTLEQSHQLVECLNGIDLGDVEVIVAPIFLHLPAVVARLKSSIGVAAQNCSFEGYGAFTGDVSAEHLVDMGVNWVIIGHSERRAHFKEEDSVLASKLRRAVDKGLRVVYCIGEEKADREEGKTMDVCRRQLDAVAEYLTADKVVLAYEPVWAIGTGLVATPQQAQETHESIRAYLRDHCVAGVADKIRIIYGGSVSAKNCSEIAVLPDVDGFLVGGASLKPEFADVVASCHNKSGSFGPFMVDYVAYPLLLAAFLLPMVVPAHPNLQMLVLAPFTVYVGCHRSLNQLALSPGEAKQESVSKKDALQFPIVGSAVLFGLYMVVKFVSKQYLNLLLSVYFVVIGALAVHATIRAPLSNLPQWRALKTNVLRFKVQFWKSNGAREWWGRRRAWRGRALCSPSAGPLAPC